MNEVYVQVKASELNNGIMTLDVSGGSTTVTMRLLWNSANGFTGTGWKTAWDSSLVPLSEAWMGSPAQKPDGSSYAASFGGFIEYVGTNPDNLNKWLDEAGWTNAQKSDFIHAVWGSASAAVEKGCLQE